MLDDFREWLSDNLRYILLGLAILLVLIIAFCIVRLVGGKGSDKEDTQNDAPVTVQTQTEETAAQEPSTEAPTLASQVEDTQDVEAEALAKDDTAVLTLTKDYYTAVAGNDTASLAQIVDPWDTAVETATLSNSEIESYNNIMTYSKKGLDDGSFVVFAYYEAKIVDVDMLAPTLAALYMRTNEEGKLTVYPFRVHEDDAISDFINQRLTDDDVQALVKDVQTKYDAAVSSDEKLAEYINTANGTAQETETEADDGTQQTSDAAGTQMTAAYGLNVRSEANTNATIVAALAVGQVVTVTGETSDGVNTWYQVSVDLGNGMTAEGYVRSDLLTPVG